MLVRKWEANSCRVQSQFIDVPGFSVEAALCFEMAYAADLFLTRRIPMQIKENKTQTES